MTQDVRSDPGGLEPGEQLAGYLIQEQIGRGGMAVVYRALDLRLDRLVALKVLAPHLGQDEAFRQRFSRESQAAAGVDHPHIVPVFEAGEAGGVLFIAMRYVGRGDVRSLIRAEGRLTAARVLPIISQVGSALDAAHAYGLVHRDVKPGNILLAQASDGSDHAYLADFGLSKNSLASVTLTATGQFLGTLDYVSPEQIQGQHVDGRADQYALACTVVEMLTGAPPFQSDDSMALMWAQLESAPPRLTKLRPDLPPAVDQVIATAMAKSPAGRFASCRDFALALSAACAQGTRSHRTGSAPDAADVPGQAGPNGLSREPWESRWQDGRQRQEAAFAGDVAGQPENRHPEAWNQEPWQPEPWQPEDWRQDRGQRDRGQPDRGQPDRGQPDRGQPDRGQPDRGQPEVPRQRDDFQRPGAGLAAAPPATSAPRPDRGALPVPVTSWDGHVPGSDGRPFTAGPDVRPPPLVREPASPPGGPGLPPGAGSGRSGSVHQETRPHQLGGSSRQRGRSSGVGRRGRGVALAVLAGVACAAIAGGVAYKLADRHPTTPAPASSNSPGTGLSPEQAVLAYFAAINRHRFQKAWEIGGKQGSLATFEKGYNGTAHDVVRITHIQGDVVTITLRALQSDGTVKLYAGTYTVANGVIVGSDMELQSAT